MGLASTQEDIDNFNKAPNDNILNTFFLITLTAPFVEELAFRKYIPDVIAPKMSPLTTFQEASLTSGLFGVYHLQNLCSNQSSGKTARVIYQCFFTTFWLGPLCWLAKRKVNILASILFHSGFNYAGISHFTSKERVIEIIKELPPMLQADIVARMIIQIVMLSTCAFIFCTTSIYLFSKTIYPLISAGHKP